MEHTLYTIEHTNSSESRNPDEINPLGVSRQVSVVAIALQEYDHYSAKIHGRHFLQLSNNMDE